MRSKSDEVVVMFERLWTKRLVHAQTEAMVSFAEIRLLQGSQKAARG